MEGVHQATNSPHPLVSQPYIPVKQEPSNFRHQQPQQQHQQDHQDLTVESIKREIFAQHPTEASQNLVTVVPSSQAGGLRGGFTAGRDANESATASGVGQSRNEEEDNGHSSVMTSLGGALSLFPATQGITPAQIDTPDGPISVLLVQGQQLPESLMSGAEVSGSVQDGGHQELRFAPWNFDQATEDVTVLNQGIVTNDLSTPSTSNGVTSPTQGGSSNPAKGKGKGKTKGKTRAYDIFAKQRYHDLKMSSERQITIGELSRIVAQEWRNLPKDQQQFYEHKAHEADRDQPPRNETQPRHSGGGNSTNNTPRQAPVMKKSMSGFILFSKERRHFLKEKYPDKTFGEVSKKTGEEWRSLSQEERSEYEQRAALISNEKAAEFEEMCARQQRDIQQNVNVQQQPESPVFNPEPVASGSHLATQAVNAHHSQGQPSLEALGLNAQQLNQLTAAFQSGQLQVGQVPESLMYLIQKHQNNQLSLQQQQQEKHQQHLQQMVQQQQHSVGALPTHSEVVGEQGHKGGRKKAVKEQGTSSGLEKAIKPGSRSGFILFSKEIRNRLKETYPNATFGELSKMTGLEWKQLTSEDRKDYEDRAIRLAEEKYLKNQQMSSASTGTNHQQAPATAVQSAGSSHHHVGSVAPQQLVQPSQAGIRSPGGGGVRLMGGGQGVPGHPTDNIGVLLSTLGVQPQILNESQPVSLFGGLGPTGGSQMNGQPQYVTVSGLNPSATQPVNNPSPSKTNNDQRPSLMDVDDGEPPETISKEQLLERVALFEKHLLEEMRSKQPPGGFILFSKTIRQRLRNDNPNEKFGTISRLTGIEWSKLSKEAKADWEKWAHQQADSERALSEAGGSPSEGGTHHGEAELLPETPGEKRVFACGWNYYYRCAQQFPSLYHLYEHLCVEHLSNAGADPNTYCRWSTCCKYSPHGNPVDKPGKKFPNLTRLLRHIRVKHLVRSAKYMPESSKEFENLWRESENRRYSLAYSAFWKNHMEECVWGLKKTNHRLNTTSQRGKANHPETARGREGDPEEEDDGGLGGMVGDHPGISGTTQRVGILDPEHQEALSQQHRQFVSLVDAQQHHHGAHPHPATTAGNSGNGGQGGMVVVSCVDGSILHQDCTSSALHQHGLVAGVHHHGMIQSQMPPLFDPLPSTSSMDPTATSSQGGQILLGHDNVGGMAVTTLADQSAILVGGSNSVEDREKEDFAVDSFFRIAKENAGGGLDEANLFGDGGTDRAKSFMMVMEAKMEPMETKAEMAPLVWGAMAPKQEEGYLGWNKMLRLKVSRGFFQFASEMRTVLGLGQELLRERWRGLSSSDRAAYSDKYQSGTAESNRYWRDRSRTLSKLDRSYFVCKWKGCGTVRKGKGSLFSHWKASHLKMEKDEKAVCGICGEDRWLDGKRTLRRHVLRQHLNEAVLHIPGSLTSAT